MEPQEKLTEVFNELKKLVPGVKSVTDLAQEDGFRTLTMRLSSGACFYMYFDSYKKKIHTKGQYPRDLEGRYQDPKGWGVIPYGDSAPECSSGSETASARIAGRITTHFLEYFEPIWLECQSRLADLRLRLTEMERIGSEFQSMISARYVEVCAYSATCKSNDLGIEVAAFRKGEIKCDLILRNITLEEAKAIIRMRVEKS